MTKILLNNLWVYKNLKTLFIVNIISFFVCLVCLFFGIKLLKAKKAGQPILKYVEEHKNKSGTPTMGGLFFVLPSIIIFFVFGGGSYRVSLVCSIIALAFLIVGFLDDFIKIKSSQNQGLKAYQKIIFQLVISFFAGLFAYTRGLTVFYLPFSRNFVDLGIFSFPLISLVFIAITNSVNLTDGLDGLAGGTCSIYLFFMMVLIGFQISMPTNFYQSDEEYYMLMMLACSVLGGIFAFLVFNTAKASVFMGDTGSLALGGLLGGISVFSLNTLIIPVLGIMFVFTSISVIMQVLYYKKTKKRIFLMAPFHHHLEKKGLKESKISYIYMAITGTLGCLLILVYLWGEKCKLVVKRF